MDVDVDVDARIGAHVASCLILDEETLFDESSN